MNNPDKLRPKQARAQNKPKDPPQRKRQSSEKPQSPVLTVLASEEKFRRLFEAAQDGILLLEAGTGDITDANPFIEALLGWSRSELVGKKLWEIGAFKEIFASQGAFSLLQKRHHIYYADIPLETRDGRRRNVEFTGNVYRAGGQKIIQCNIRDITGRRQAEETLRDSQHMLQIVLDSIPSAVFWKDRNSFILGGNLTWLKQAGLKSLEDVVGKSDYDLPWTKEQADAFREADNRVMESGVPEYGIIETYRRSDGSMAWAATNKVPLRDAQGSIIGILGTYEDITERKQAEEKIRQNEARFKALFMSMSDGFYLSEVIYDDDGNPCDYRFLEVNPKFEQIMGLGRDQIIGKRYKEFVPVDTTQWLDLYCKVARTGTPLKYEFYSPEYHSHFETYSYQPTKGQVSVIVSDISERKQAETALRESAAQLSNAMKIAHLGYWEYDVASDLFTFNDHFYAIFRTTAEQVGGYTLSSAEYAERFVHPDDRQEVGKEIQKALEATDPNFSRQMEHRIIFANGEIGTIAVRFFIIKDEQGRTIKTFGANQDITERRQAEDKIRQQLIELQRWYEVTVEREARALELKHEVNELLQRLNEPPRYPSAQE
jgi:PAS domain S-box-containing protein